MLLDPYDSNDTDPTIILWDLDKEEPKDVGGGLLEEPIWENGLHCKDCNPLNASLGCILRDHDGDYEGNTETIA